MASRSYDYDVIILGSGAAGSIAAQQLAKAGKSVAIIESDLIGGRAPNHGALPTQALMHAAKIYEAARTGGTFGIRGSTTGYNYPSVKAWKDTVIRRSGMHNNASFFTQRGITVIRGRGYFLDKSTVSVGSTRLTAEYLIIATGTEMSVPRIQGLDKSHYLSPRDALHLTRPPRRVAILGGGPTGCELASIFAIFGSKVTLIESAARLMPREEPEVSKALETQFSQQYKMNLLLDSTIASVSSSGPFKQVKVKGQDPFTVDEIIVATDRYAATDIGLENAGVSYNQRYIEVSNTLRTTNKSIYAIGDCITNQQFAHVATSHGHIASFNILHPKRHHATVENYDIVRTYWTSPEVAAVGYTKRQLTRRGETCRSVTVGLDIVCRSNTTNAANGFLKLICDDKSLEVLSATIVGPNASEIIHTLSLAVHNHLTIWQLASSNYAFGTWSELIRVAAAKLMYK